MLRMTDKLYNDWIAALRSGKYKQGKGALCRKGNTYAYCCLGVLCELMGLKKEAVPGQNNYRFFNPEDGDWYTIYLPEGLVAKQADLAVLNDEERLSFLEIADELEKNPGKYRG